MEWLDLQFFGPHMDNGRQLLYSSHNPYLVFLAYLVACAADIPLDARLRAANAATRYYVEHAFPPTREQLVAQMAQSGF